MLTQVAAFTMPPFRIEEEGWGEFDMTIVLTAIDKGGDHNIQHDLNFAENRYEAKHPVVCWLCATGRPSRRIHYRRDAHMTLELQKSQARAPRRATRERAGAGRCGSAQEDGRLGEEETAGGSRGTLLLSWPRARKKRLFRPRDSADREQVNMDKLADNLQKLQEDDLLQVVQLIHDHKTSDSYTKNDVDGMFA